MPVTTDDPRLVAPQCSGLTPIETVHSNPWFAVRNRGGYFTVEYHRVQVVILPVVDDRAIVMPRVRRPILADATLELPAGGACDGESPVETAARELAEETGIRVDDRRRFVLLPPLAITPRFPVLPHVFQVDLSAREYADRGEHDHEVADVACLAFGAIADKIAAGEIYNGFYIGVVARFLLLRRTEPLNE